MLFELFGKMKFIRISAAAELFIDDIVALCDALLEAHRDWLPQYH